MKKKTVRFYQTINPKTKMYEAYYFKNRRKTYIKVALPDPLTGAPMLGTE